MSTTMIELTRAALTSDLVVMLFDLEAAEDAVDPGRDLRRRIRPFADQGPRDFADETRATNELIRLVRELRQAARDEIDRRIPRP